MENRDDLTADYVRQILHYDPETGVFIWRERDREHFATLNAYRSWNTQHSGSIAGSVRSDGYCIISTNGRRYLAHRLAWLYMTGSWPNNQIDHRDLDPSNNRFTNLRDATGSENLRNRGPQSNNTSGVKGVCWDKQREKWHAKISVNGKDRFIGYFDQDKLEDAATAYEKAARERHGDFARVS